VLVLVRDEFRHHRASLTSSGTVCSMASAEHWDTVYGTRRANEMSWFQASPDTSVRLLSRYATRGGAFIDVGAGESVLADTLLDQGWTDVTVLDVSTEAVSAVQTRLAGRAGVSFVVADLLDWEPDRQYDAWHDRAVLHFLVDAAQQDHYSRVSADAIRQGGIAVVGTFATDGPTHCSGLPTCRYDVPMLAALCGSHFALEHHEREEHLTPSGAIQPFTWVVLRRL
jgi:2-polyprenyl-3-methyl-5-hydroxy-6-metoxy-1,4-benzoquinol methylase